MNNKLSHQTILITGASSGIGEEIAYQLAVQGANLILCARRFDKLQQVKEICYKLGAQNIYIYSLDLTNLESIDDLLKNLDQENIRIDILINNAGFGHSSLFVETDFKIILELFKVNVLGLMYLTQQVAITMLEEDSSAGQIINIASLAGKVATVNFAPYAATKAAVIAFSNSLRMELKPHNIQVTVINLGPTNTPFFDQIQGKRKERGQNGFFTLSQKQAGKAVVNTIGRKKREVNYPMLLNIGTKLYQIAPKISDNILTRYYNK